MDDAKDNVPKLNDTETITTNEKFDKIMPSTNGIKLTQNRLVRKSILSAKKKQIQNKKSVIICTILCFLNEMLEENFNYNE